MAADLLAMLERAGFEPAGSLSVQAEADRFAAGALARSAGRRLGMPPLSYGAAQIAACELAGNMVRHAGGGTLALGVCAEAGLLRLSARDDGPPIRNVELAFADGSTNRGPLLPEQVFRRRGIGAGLGALRRLALALVIEQAPRGKVITAYFGAGDAQADAGCLVVVRAVAGV